jgi:hypothetical protein
MGPTERGGRHAAGKERDMETRKHMPMNLQLFAATPPEDPATPPNPPTPPAEPAQPPKSAPASFEDMLKADKGFQGEFDRRVAQALGTSKEKWEADTRARIEAERTEAEKLARMSAEERAREEGKKREDELARREAEVTRREIIANLSIEAGKRGLPAEIGAAEFWQHVNLTAENYSAVLEALEKAHRAALQAEVDKLKSGTPPKDGMTPGDEAQLRAQDGLLGVLLAQAQSEILAYCNRPEMVPGLQGAQVRLATVYYNRMGAEGESSHAEGGVSRAMETGIPGDIAASLDSYRWLRAVTRGKSA